MGWGRMLLLGNVGQQMDIGDVQAELSSLRRQLNGLNQWGNANTGVDRKQNDRIKELEQANDDLRMCVATLARIMLAKGIVTADELGRVADVIDDRG